MCTCVHVCVWVRVRVRGIVPGAHMANTCRAFALASLTDSDLEPEEALGGGPPTSVSAGAASAAATLSGILRALSCNARICAPLTERDML